MSLQNVALSLGAAQLALQVWGLLPMPVQWIPS
jgi:hypothetical protein